MNFLLHYHHLGFPITPYAPYQIKAPPKNYYYYCYEFELKVLIYQTFNFNFIR